MMEPNFYEELHDHKPYNESILWQISQDYYQSKGIMAWSNKAPKIIPHKIGTNYQSAISLAQLVKKYLELYSPKTRIKVLECGAGSGRFSRHFLLAAKALGIIDKVTLIISDYSQKNLEDIAHSKILEGFNEGLEYQFKVLDIINDTLKEENIIAIFMHYVLDALPLTILRKEADQYQELYISVSKRKDQNYDVIENDFLQSRLTIKEEWRNYDWSAQSQSEQEFQEIFCKFYSNKAGHEELYYSYGALKALKNLLSTLDENGFLLSTDIIAGNKLRYAIVGNAIAHEVDNDFLLYFLKSKSYIGLAENAERKTSRLFACKNHKAFDSLINIYNQIFNQDSSIIRYLELENSIEEALEQGLTDTLLEKLQKLEKFSPYDPMTYKFYSQYYELQGNKIEAQIFLEKAKTMNFWDDI